MARRHFALELDLKIKSESVARLSGAQSDGNKLLRDAGYIQGLIAAQQLFTEIVQHEKDED